MGNAIEWLLNCLFVSVWVCCGMKVGTVLILLTVNITFDATIHQGLKELRIGYKIVA
jgi:hypothetical protein